MPLSFETVIGLEVHVQLATASKLFCSCPSAYIGTEPNTNVCPACLGLPGSLPALNRRAVELGVKAALALGCFIPEKTRFHRKNYFYPDLPKAFQVSQYDVPLAVSGSMTIFTEEKEKRINITRLHLEEDAGKLVHETADGRLSGAAFSLVDYNRAGVPLAEIVSEPELSSPDEAREYVLMIRRLVRYLEVSDGDMESGSLRVDANISQKCSDGRWGNRVEIKNVNSIRAMERALEYETLRQRALLLKGEEIIQETRHWDDGAGVTRSSRGKEEAHDYRYFPEPDLPQIIVERSIVEKIRENLPELPWKKRERFAREWGLSLADSVSLSENPDVAGYLEKIVASGVDPQLSANWVKTVVLRVINESGLSAKELPVGPEELASLLVHVQKGSISTTAARDVLDIMLRDGLAAEDAMKKAGVSAGGVSNDSLLGVVERILGDNIAETALLLSGEDASGKKRKFLLGLVMREIRGQASPEDVSAMIDRVLGGMRG